MGILSVPKNRITARLLACLVAALPLAGHGAVIQWLSTAESLSGNVTASTNGGSGWTFDGTAGVAYDFGALDALGGKAIDGSSVEFIFNLTDGGASNTIASVGGWSPGGEFNQFKVEQWPNTGKFGVTLEGIADYSLNTNSIFGQTTHVVFIRQASGELDLYINGVFAETHGAKTNWRLDGGVGRLGSRSNGTQDIATGSIFGVASYDVSLTSTQVSDLYTAYAAIPEPSSAAIVFSFFGLGIFAFRARNRGR